MENTPPLYLSSVLPYLSLIPISSLFSTYLYQRAFLLHSKLGSRLFYFTRAHCAAVSHGIPAARTRTKISGNPFFFTPTMNFLTLEFPFSCSVFCFLCGDGFYFLFFFFTYNLIERVA